MTEPESYSQWSAKNALDKDPIDALRDYTGYLRTEYLNRGELNEQVEQDIQVGLEEKLRGMGNTEEELADLNTRLFAPKQNTLLDADLVSSYLALDDPDANEPSTKENAALLRKYASSLKFNPAGAAELEGAASELLQDSDLVRRARESAVDRGDLQAVGINNKDGGRDVYTGSNTFSDEDLPLVASSLATSGALDTSDFLRLKNKMRRVHGGKATANEEQRLQEFNNALEVLSKTDLNVKNILGLASNVEAKKSAAEQETLAKRGGMFALAAVFQTPLELIAEGLGNIKSAVTGQDFEGDFGLTDDEVLSEQLRKGDVTAEQLIAERLSDNEALRKRFSPEEIARYTRDIVTANTNYAFDAEKPETGIRELSTGAVVVAPALLAKPQLFEASLGKAALNEEQRAAARLQREASLDERAPQMLKLLTELDDDAASAFATAKQQGKTDRAFLEEWMSNEDNYSAFNNRLSSTGLSAWSGVKDFALGLAASTTGSETISKFAVESAANTAAQREKRKELASMFGDDYGLGQQIFEALPQVATDLALAFATAGAGAVAAKGVARAAIATAGRPAIMNTARAFAKQGIMSLDDVSFAAFRKATTAGGGVSTSDAIRAIGADWIKRASGDLATKILPVALPAFSRSTSNSYVSIYGGLPEGMSHEAKHKQALAGAVATGFATAAITVGMGRIGFGGPESLAVLGSKKTISDLTFREAKKVFEVVNNQGKAVSNAAFQKALAAEVGGAYKNLAAGVGKGVLGESFEEALDQSINIAIEDASLKRETPLAEKLQQVWNAALVGGAIGGGFSLGQQLAPVSKSAATRALEARVSVLDGIAKRLSTSGAPETAASVQRMMDAANAAAVASTKKDTVAADAQAAKAPTTAVRTVEEGNELGFDDPRGVPPADTRIADLVGERVFIDGTDINGIAEIDADTGEVVINFSKPTKVKGKPNVTRYVLGRKYQKATGLSLKPKVKTLTKAVGSLPVGTRVFSANKMEFVLPTIEAVDKARAAGKPLLVLQRDENQRVVGVTIRKAALVARPTTTTDATITDPELMREVLRLYPAPTGGFQLESGEQLELDFNAPREVEQPETEGGPPLIPTGTGVFTLESADQLELNFGSAPPEPELQQLLEDPNQLELDFEAEAPETTKANLNALSVILAGDPVLNFLRTADPKRKGFAASVQQISDGEWSAAGDVLDTVTDFVAELGDSEPLLTKAALDALGPILFKYDTGTTIRKRAAKQAATKSARRNQGARPTSPAPKAEAPPVAPTPTPAPLTPSQFTARAQNRAVDDIVTQAGENSLSRWAAELPTITGFEPQAHGTSIDRAIDVVLNGVSSDQTFFTGPLVGREIAFTGAGVRTYGQAQVVMVGKGNNKIESVADIDYVVVNDNVAPDIELLREQYPQVEWLTIPEADTRYRATQPVVRLTPTPTPKPAAKKTARKAAKPEPAAEGAMQVLTDAEQLEIMALFASIDNRINKGQILGGYSGNLSQVTPARDIRRLLAAKGYKESDTPKDWVDAASVDKGSPRDIEKLIALRDWAYSGGKPAPKTTAAEPQAPAPTREEIEDWLNEGGNAQTLVGASLLDKQGRSFKIEEVSIGDGGELEFVTDDPTTVTVPLTVGNLIEDTNPESFTPYLEAGNVEPEAGAPAPEPSTPPVAPLTSEQVEEWYSDIDNAKSLIGKEITIQLVTYDESDTRRVVPTKVKITGVGKKYGIPTYRDPETGSLVELGDNHTFDPESFRPYMNLGIPANMRKPRSLESWRQSLENSGSEAPQAETYLKKKESLRLYKLSPSSTKTDQIGGSHLFKTPDGELIVADKDDNNWDLRSAYNSDVTSEDEGAIDNEDALQRLSEELAEKRRQKFEEAVAKLGNTRNYPEVQDLLNAGDVVSQYRLIDYANTLDPQAGTLSILAPQGDNELRQNIADIPAALRGMLPAGFVLAADPNMDGALGYNAVTDPTVIRYNPNLVGSFTLGLARADALATLRTAVDHELGHAAAEEAFGQDGYESLAVELGEDMLTNIASIYYSLVEPDFNLRAERIKADRESGALPDWKIAAEWVRMEIERIANGRTSERRMLFLRTNPSLLAKFIDALGAFVTRLRARFFENPTTGTAASISNAARQLRKLKNGGYLPAAPKADPNALGDAAEFERALTGASDSTLFSLPIGAATKAGQAEIDGFWRRLGKRFENLPSYLKVEKEARDGIMAVATNQIEYFQKRVVRLLAKAPNVSLDDVRDVLGRTAPALDDAARARVRAELDVFINKLPADMDGVLAEEMIQNELYRLQRVERIASNTAFAQQQADAQQRIRNSGNDELADLLVKFRKDIDNMSERFKHLNTSIDDNLGVYLTRTFDFFTTEGWSLMASNKGVMPDGTQLAMFRGKEVDFNKLRDNAAKAYEADVVAEAQRRGEVATAEEIQERTHEKLDKYLAALQRSTEQYAGTNTDSIKKDIKRFLPKRDLDNAVLDLLGVIEDPIENAMRTMANVAKIAANDRFLSGARSTLLSMGLASNKPDAKNSTPAFGKRYADAALDPLEGLYTTPEIARALQAEFGEGARRIDSTTDTLMQDVGTWVRHGAAFATTMKTLPSVGFHARNMVSGQLLLTTAQGVAPANKHTLKAFKLSFLANFESRKRTPEEAAEIERLIELQMLRDDTSARALKDMTRGFEFSSEQELDSLFLAYQEAASGNPGALKAIFKKAGVRYDKTIDILASLNNVTDGAVKVQAYYTNLEVLKADKKQQLAQEAADPEQRLLRTLELKAADKTKLCTPTHSRRFDWVKSMNKTSAGLILFPFAGWKTEVFRTMYNIPRLAYKEITQGEGPAERAMGVKRLVGWTTVMFGAGLAMGFAYQMIFGFLAGLGDEEDRFTGRELTPEELFALRESMPEWQKGHDVFTRLTENGVMVIDMTAITPYAQLTDMGNIILEGIQTGEGPSGRKVASYVVNQLIGMQIAAKTASEIWPQNQNDFGQPIYRENDDAAQVFGKSMLHYMEGAMEPAISAFVRKVTRTGEQDVKEMIVGEFTGARPRIQKLSEIEYRAFRGVKKMLDDSAQIKSSLVTGRKLGDDEVEQTLLEHQEALNRTQRKLAKTIEGLKGLGSTRGSIFGSAKNAGFSAQRVELAEQGRNYRWTPNQAWLKGVYQNMTRTGEDDPMNRINAIRRTLSGQPAMFNVVE